MNGIGERVGIEQCSYHTWLRELPIIRAQTSDWTNYRCQSPELPTSQQKEEPTQSTQGWAFRDCRHRESRYDVTSRRASRRARISSKDELTVSLTFNFLSDLKLEAMIKFKF